MQDLVILLKAKGFSETQDSYSFGDSSLSAKRFQKGVKWDEEG